jgi:hypothetical protein
MTHVYNAFMISAESQTQTMFVPSTRVFTFNTFRNKALHWIQIIKHKPIDENMLCDCMSIWMSHESSTFSFSCRIVYFQFITPFLTSLDIARITWADILLYINHYIDATILTINNKMTLLYCKFCKLSNLLWYTFVHHPRDILEQTNFSPLDLMLNCYTLCSILVHRNLYHVDKC